MLKHDQLTCKTVQMSISKQSRLCIIDKNKHWHLIFDNKRGRFAFENRPPFFSQAFFDRKRDASTPAALTAIISAKIARASLESVFGRVPPEDGE